MGHVVSDTSGVKVFRSRSSEAKQKTKNEKGTVVQLCRAESGDRGCSLWRGVHRVEGGRGRGTQRIQCLEGCSSAGSGSYWGGSCSHLPCCPASSCPRTSTCSTGAASLRPARPASSYRSPAGRTDAGTPGRTSCRTDRQSDSQSDRQLDSQTVRQAGRQTDRQFLSLLPKLSVLHLAEQLVFVSRVNGAPL